MSRVLRKMAIPAVSLAIAIAPALLFVTVQPAQASGTWFWAAQGFTDNGNCANGWICMYGGNSYAGDECAFDVSSFGTAWQSFQAPADVCFGTGVNDPKFNNDMKSWINNSNLDGSWSGQSDGGGTVHCMNANGQNSNLSAGDANTASSVKHWASGTHC
jgi:hypothetical protein